MYRNYCFLNCVGSLIRKIGNVLKEWRTKDINLIKKKGNKNWDKNKVTVELKIFVRTYGKWYLNLWGWGECYTLKRNSRQKRFWHLINVSDVKTNSVWKSVKFHKRDSWYSKFSKVFVIPKNVRFCQFFNQILERFKDRR